MTTLEITPVTPARSWREFFPPATRVRLAVVAGLLLLVYWRPLRYALVARWLNDDNWSHGWLIPLFSLYFLMTRRERLFQARFKGCYLGAIVLGLSLGLYFVSAWWWLMGYPQAVSIVGAVFGVTLLLGGWEVIRVTWFPILFLLLAVPLPDRLYFQLTFPLREFASHSAAAIMPLFAPGLYTEAQAVVIDYAMPNRPPGQLNVEEACAGMRLMMAFVTLGVTMAYLGDRPMWQRIVVVLMCIPIAVFCNTLRVTVTGLLYVYGYPSLAKGMAHQALGILMLGLALGLYWLIGYVLSHLWMDEAEDASSVVSSAS